MSVENPFSVEIDAKAKLEEDGFLLLPQFLNLTELKEVEENLAR